MSLLIPETGLLLWMVIIFAIVLFILVKWGFPVITGMIDRRSEYIEQSLRNAEEAEKRLAALGEEQQQMLEEVRREQAKLLKEAADTKARMISDARAEAEKESALIMARTHEAIAAEKESALADARREIALLGVSVAEKILRDHLSDREAQMALLEKLGNEALRVQDKS